MWAALSMVLLLASDRLNAPADKAALPGSVAFMTLALWQTVRIISPDEGHTPYIYDVSCWKRRHGRGD